MTVCGLEGLGVVKWSSVVLSSVLCREIRKVAILCVVGSAATRKSPAVCCCPTAVSLLPSLTGGEAGLSHGCWAGLVCVFVLV